MASDNNQDPNKTYSQFLVRLTIITLVMAVLLLGLTFLTAFQPLVLVSWIALVYFAVLTGGIHWFYHKGVQQKQHAAFMTGVFGTMGIKMLASLTFVVAYFYMAKPASMLFVIPVLVFYFVFTIYETKSLLNTMKQN